LLVESKLVQTPDDKFAKDYLEELLKPYGKVDTSEKILGEILDTDDRELVMRLEPLYQQDREQAKLEGRQEGRRQIVESLLQVRFWHFR